MILDLPPELIVLALSYSNIQQVHSFQLVSRAAYEIIKSHSSSVYRALSIRYGLAQEEQDLERVFKNRKVYFDWLKEPRGEGEGRPLVTGWRDYVRHHFMLERNWKEGRYVAARRDTVNGVHRIQIDEVEGAVLSTRTLGTVTSTCLHSGESLWTELQAAAWAHCEFDNGFLIWGRRDHAIEIWRRESDQLSDPLEACNPDGTQLVAQKNAGSYAEDSDSSESGGENDAGSRTPRPNRGHFRPFTLLRPPRTTSASRFVYPHLLLATPYLQHAYIYNVPSNRLIKTIELADSEEHFRRIYYVEHNRTHIFICTEDAIYIYGKEDGRLFLKITSNITPHIRLRVVWGGLTLCDPMSAQPPAQRMKLVAVEVEEAQYTPSAGMGEFCAVHVSPCGGIWVIMNEADYILVVTGGDAEDPTQIKVVSVFIGDPALTYLAFDGHHIVVAGSKGIYVISLNRFRDPTLSVEAALTSVQLIPPQKQVDMRATSCLQVTDTAIWHVARRSFREFGAVTTRIDFATSLDA